MWISSGVSEDRNPRTPIEIPSGVFPGIVFGVHSETVSEFLWHLPTTLQKSFKISFRCTSGNYFQEFFPRILWEFQPTFLMKILLEFLWNFFLECFRIVFHAFFQQFLKFFPERLQEFLRKKVRWSTFGNVPRALATFLQLLYGNPFRWSSENYVRISFGNLPNKHSFLFRVLPSILSGDPTELPPRILS